MAHRLTPTERSSRRTSDELIVALRDAFPFVEIDRERGSDVVGDTLVALLRMKSGYSRWKDPPPDVARIDSTIARLNELRGQAVFVTVAEAAGDQDRRISFNLIPGEDIIVGYANQKHQDTATPIAIRVAEILGYDVKFV
jgi:hypothetical protein